MSSFALKAFADVSQHALDSAFRMVESDNGETTVRFGDGERGAALPVASRPTLDRVYSAGPGASGNVVAGTPQQPGLLMRCGIGDVVFDPVRHYSGVLAQQGRVQTDADYDEATQVDRWRALLADRPDFDVVTADGGSGSSSGSGDDGKP